MLPHRHKLISRTVRKLDVTARDRCSARLEASSVSLETAASPADDQRGGQRFPASSTGGPNAPLRLPTPLPTAATRRREAWPDGEGRGQATLALAPAAVARPAPPGARPESQAFQDRCSLPAQPPGPPPCCWASAGDPHPVPRRPPGGAGHFPRWLTSGRLAGPRHLCETHLQCAPSPGACRWFLCDGI